MLGRVVLPTPPSGAARSTFGRTAVLFVTPASPGLPSTNWSTGTIPTRASSTTPNCFAPGVGRSDRSNPPTRRAGLSRQPTAIDRQHVAMHVVRRRRRQEHDGAAEFIRAAPPPGRD